MEIDLDLLSNKELRELQRIVNDACCRRWREIEDDKNILIDYIKEILNED